MDITPLIPKNRNIINSYGPEGFKINEITYKNTIILTPTKLLEVKIKSIEEIFEEDLRKVFDIDPEILLIGSGINHSRISDISKNKIKEQYPLIGIDEMTSGAACRTYNILMSEDRKVAVILLPIV